MTSDNESLWAARRARARRWIQAGSSLHGYPALIADDETEHTLAAAPPEQAKKKSKPAAPPDE